MLYTVDIFIFLHNYILGKHILYSYHAEYFMYYTSSQFLSN